MLPVYVTNSCHLIVQQSLRSTLSVGYLLLVVATLIAVFDLVDGRDGLNPVMVCLLGAGASMVIADACAGSRKA